MTPIQIPLRRTLMRRPIWHLTPGRPQELEPFDPDLYAPIAWMQSPADFIEEPDASCMNRNTGCWKGVHWYRGPEDNRQTEIG